ncbi:uncharacterized protein C2845_PM13G13070 [Panicum miliaceum]|uniref:Uncharacterized protein n=1 Tax=Panicum miliaceum TaxID=4540 RepID=A0A3L6RMP7_PANMI|nr:uncharacterized protein C2845_PM13G13070 [Panicum miliaceum]
MLNPPGFGKEVARRRHRVPAPPRPAGSGCIRRRRRARASPRLLRAGSVLPRAHASAPRCCRPPPLAACRRRVPPALLCAAGREGGGLPREGRGARVQGWPAPPGCWICAPAALGRRRRCAARGGNRGGGGRRGGEFTHQLRRLNLCARLGGVQKSSRSRRSCNDRGDELERGQERDRGGEADADAAALGLMRKAGAKEGSILSKGAVDVNSSPVSTAIAGRPSMIKFCTCSIGSSSSSSSSLRSLKNTNISMTCKGCTGESTTGRGGPSCSSKLSSMGLELPRPIDPEVRWKTVNRRQRAARKARTFGKDRRNAGIGSFYLFGSATNQEMAQEDAPVSESEKKRRFLMDCSPSPPPTPLLVDPYEKILGSSSRGIKSYEKHRKIKMLASECTEERKGPFGADDFSGISILAAAACESEMDGDILNGACSKLADPLQERKLENTRGSTELSLLHDMKEDKLKIPGASHCIYDRPLGSSNSAPDMNPLLATTLSNSEKLVESASALKVNYSSHSAMNSANQIEIASDAKSSSVAMADSPSNPEKTIGCSQDADTQTNHANATRDSRLHWDLNVPMEAWDTDCGGDDDPTAATISDHNDAGNDMNKPQPSHDHFDSFDAGDVSNSPVEKIQMAVVSNVCVTKDEGDSPADSSSHLLLHQSSQNLQLLESESVGNDALAKTMDLPDQQKNRFATIVESHIGSNPEPALIIEHFPSPCVEKIDGSHPPSVDCEGCNSLQTSELGSTVKPLASRLVSEESTNLPTVTPFHKKVTDFGWSDNKLEEAFEQSISESKNQELLDVDSGTSKMDQSVSKNSGHDTDVFYVNKSPADAENLTHPEDNPGSSHCDMAHVHEEDGADAMINSKDCLITCANSSSAETYYISSTAPQVPLASSECPRPGVTDANSIVDSRENEHGKVASNTYSEHCYETDTSYISENLAGFGKGDVEEDDSQYEDGELRESGDRYWVGDGYEEVKPANWHYQVSDYKNGAAIPHLAPLPVDCLSKNVGIRADSYNETQRKEDVPILPISSKRSWLTNCLDGGPLADGKAQSIHSRGDTQMYGINPGRVPVGSAAIVSQSERCSDGLGDDLSSIRMKNTGWDMLPEDQKHSRRDPKDGADSSNQCGLDSSDTAGDDESLRKMGLSNKDVQQMEWQKSFDRPQRNELSRSDDGYGSGSKAERTIDSHRSHGTYDASRHIQTGNRGQWMENSKHPRSARRKSPEYFNYGPSGPRNAAEATVAKMESNGFVVAPDGTLVRAVDAANAGQMGRRMRNTSSSSYRPLSGRGSPIDRDGTCGMFRGPVHSRDASPERHFGVNSNRSGRYCPEMEKDHTDGNLSSVRCSLPNRQRGIPAGRASLNLSRAHSRSPSGSRSRSPHDWTSPRNRRKIMANGGSTLRRNSRSPPNHMAKVRIGRMASPKRQPRYDDRSLRYSPSRNHTYSQHASTWVDGRNGSTVDLSDHNKRYSRRSPPPRITSRNDRFDVMDSQGRSRSGEFYRSANGRLPCGYDRSNKHDGNGDDQREYAVRYGNHSVKPYDRNGAVKQFRNNAGDKFRTRISAPRSPESQRRVSPRRFDRSFER